MKLRENIFTIFNTTKFSPFITELTFYREFYTIEVGDRIMSDIVVDREEYPSAIEAIQQIRADYSEIWDEIERFIRVLDELGVGSYKLTGSLENPVIAGYSLA
jgi:hypothetical protein